MTPLRDRIPGALALQPMTVDQLARCLTASRSAVRTAVVALRDAKVIRRTGSVGKIGTGGKPWPQYGLGAGKTPRRIR